MLYLIRPSQIINFESYAGGKEGISAAPNSKTRTTIIGIPQKRINQEIAEKIRYDETKGIGIKGLRLLLNDNYVTLEGSFIIYKNPVGLTLGFKPRYQNGKLFLTMDTARIGLIKIPPKAVESIIKNIIKQFEQDSVLGYSQATQEIYIDLKNWSGNFDIKDVKVKKDVLEAEISNI